ncbi:MAG: hypothetical protein GXN92_02510 [Candidatus Micrarchaeota archaeon]|nr:hypothetical protein [Candidatus Micrarchaeota archaeon]
MIPSKIYQVRFYFLPDIKDELLKKLHELGVFELKQPEIKEFPTNILDKEHAIFSKLEYDLQAVEDGGKLLSLDELALKLPEIQKKAQHLQELYLKRKQLRAKQQELLEKIEDGNLILTYVPYKELPERFKLHAFLVPKKKFKPEMLKRFTEAEYYDLGKNVLVIGITPADQEVSFPEGEKLYVPKSEKELHQYQQELKKISEELKKLEEEISRYQKDPLLKDAKASVSVYLERENAKALFARGKHFYLLEAYIPEKFLKPALNAIQKHFGDKVYIEYEEAKKQPPTYLEIPKMVESFHRLNLQFGVPSYVDIDPSFFYYIFVPIMFGFIVGDALYGLIILALAYWAEKHEKLRDYAKLWKLGAIASIIFGIAFNEFMGFPIQAFLEPLGIHIEYHPILHRAHDVGTYMLVGLVLGYVHLLLAYLLGLYKYWVLKADLKHTLAKLGWLLLLIDIGLVALNADLSIGGISIQVLLALIGLIFIVYGEGLMGIIELPSIVSNLLSYLRLPIVGIVSVILAELINGLLGGLPSIIVGLIFVLILHFAHALLILLEGSIQAGRLNLVEFRSKFYTGGGRLFKPFMLKKEVIKDGRRSNG